MQDRTVEQADPSAKKRERVAPNLWRRTSDGRYEDIRVNPATGKQQLRTLKAGTLTEAKREQRALAVQIDRGEAVAPSRMVASEVAADYFAAAAARVATGEMAARTRDLYRQRWDTHLEKRIGRMRVQAVQATHVGTVLRELRGEGLSSWTCHGILVAAAAVFGHAVARGWIVESPTKRLAKGERPRGRNVKTVRILTPEEIGRVVESATSRWRPLLVSAAHTGARISELLSLTWADIDWTEGTVAITKQLGRDGKLTRTKSDNGVRTIRLSPELRRVLREHWVASGQLQGFIFTCESGRAPSYRNARRALDGAITNAGIDFDTETHRLGFHSLRHGAVSALIRAGVDPVRIASFVGDKVETILSTYAHEWSAAKGDDLGIVLGEALSF